MHYIKKILLFSDLPLKMDDNLYRMDYNLSQKRGILGNFDMLIIE